MNTDAKQAVNAAACAWAHSVTPSLLNAIGMIPNSHLVCEQDRIAYAQSAICDAMVSHTKRVKAEDLLAKCDSIQEKLM